MIYLLYISYLTTKTSITWSQKNSPTGKRLQNCDTVLQKNPPKQSPNNSNNLVPKELLRRNKNDSKSRPVVTGTVGTVSPNYFFSADTPTIITLIFTLFTYTQIDHARVFRY